MGISTDSSITLTWCDNISVDILIVVEYVGSGFDSLLECRGGIFGTGWYGLPSSMVKTNPTQNDFHQKLYGAICKQQISGGGDYLSAAADITAEVSVVTWKFWCVGHNSEDSGAEMVINMWW